MLHLAMDGRGVDLGGGWRAAFCSASRSSAYGRFVAIRMVILA